MRTITDPFASYPNTPEGKESAKDLARTMALSPCWEETIRLYKDPWIIITEDFYNNQLHVVVSFKSYT